MLFVLVHCSGDSRVDARRVVRAKERTPEKSDFRPFVMCVGVWRCTAELRKMARWGVEGGGSCVSQRRFARTEVVPTCCSPGV